MIGQEEALARDREEELIKIKKREKRAPEEKKERAPKIKHPKKEKNEVKRQRMSATPRAKGVRLDFSEEKPEVNRYWLSVAKRYRVARALAVIVLCAFLFVMLAFFRENITYANLVYLVRDLDSKNTLTVGSYNDISYDRGDNNDFDVFRSRLAVASQKGFTLYSQTGAVDLEYSDVIADPRLEVSDKYAVLYSAGDKRYSVFTTVARVLSAESKYSIEDCAVSDSGSYALLTKSQESRFLITVYNDAFQEKTKYYKDSFVMDMALSEGGDRLCAVSTKIDGASASCEVMIGKVGTKETKTFDYSGMMPLSCEYTDDGRLLVLCDTALLIFEGEKELSRISFEGLTPGCFDVSGGHIALSFPKNVLGTSNEIRVYSTDGAELCKKDLSGKISCLAADGEEYVYAVTDTEAVRLNPESGKIKKEPCELQALYAAAVPGSVIVFTPEGTESFFAK